MLERILIVGRGSMGLRHLRLARALLPSAELTLLGRHSSLTLGKDLERVNSVSSLDEALRSRPQAAVIANPSSKHLESAIPLARAGIHLLVEKPISNTAEGVCELIDICDTGKLILMTGYNLRFLPSLRDFRQLLQDGRIGRVLSVRAEVGQYLPSWRPEVDYRNTVSANKELGGGVLLELSHEIDYLRWLFGEIASVDSICNRQSDLDIDVEDTANLIFTFSGDRPVLGALNIDFVRHDRTRSCTAIGESGSLRWNGLTGSVELFMSGEKDWKVVTEDKSQPDDSYLAELSHFIDCVANGAKPIVGGADGLAVVQIIEAARLSSTTGRRAYVETKERKRVDERSWVGG